MQNPTIAYIQLLVLSIAAVAVGFAIRQFAGVWVHDSNFETFQSTLPKDKALGIVASTRSMPGGDARMLVTTNSLRMLLTGSLLVRLRSNRA